MGNKDTLAKKYLSDNKRFADIVNNAIFDGEDVVKPEDLKELDPTEIGIIPKTAGGKFLSKQKVRDILKDVLVKSCNGIYYVLVGIEHQSEIHYAMPVRNALYDILDYTKQIELATEKHKGQKTTSNKAEFLSGFTREDRLTPVVTVVVYLGTEPWNGPLSISDMYELPDKRLLKYVMDYRINLIDPHRITNYSTYRTSFSLLLQAIRFGGTAEGVKRFAETAGGIDVETARMIKEHTSIPIEFTGRGKNRKALVCNGVKEIRAEARAEEREISNKRIYVLVEKGKLLPEDAAESLEISVNQLKANMINTGYKFPD